MTDDVKPDYTTMSGAEFRRAVGADPEKWAEAFIQRGGHPLSVDVLHNEIAAWFRDAMEAAVKDVILQGTQMALDEMRRDDGAAEHD